MHEVQTPEGHCVGSLSCTGSFCLNFDISAPLVIFRYSLALDATVLCEGRGGGHGNGGGGGGGDRGGGCGGRAGREEWQMKSVSLTSQAQPRYVLPVFTADVASSACHLVQVRVRVCVYVCVLWS
jgi:hypothetical protein